MTKQEYIVEMLSEILQKYNIPPEILQYCAEDVVDGLDVWYELSGDSVASSNRYSALESEKLQAVEKIRKEYEGYIERNKEELEEQ